MKLPISATIQKVETMARYARVVVDTQETITPEQLAELFALHDKVGWFFCLNKPDDKINREELPEIHLEEGEKSPSQRLRAVLYIYWQQNTDQKQEFELYYRRWMERTIDSLKEKLT
jgi:hypothetical protein